MEILINEPLAHHTFYGVGGPADEFWNVDTRDKFGEIWAETIALGMPKIILGKGSNLLMSDRGFRGRVFSLQFEAVTFVPFEEKKKEGVLVTVEVGKNWQKFVEETNEKGFEDLCNLSGIPGNVGGFVRGNAGAFGIETGDFVQSVEFVDENGMIQRFNRYDCQFAYRESIFKRNPNWCITQVTFALTQKADSQESLTKTRTLLADRWKKYPPGKSGGSFFKNPSPKGDAPSTPEGPLINQPLFAGKLLEESGAKGDRIGNAQIAEKHANFILNLDGKATQDDILQLASKWKDIVFDKTSIELEPEIFICDEVGERVNL